MISTSAPRGAKLLITIVDQGKGEEVLRLLDAQGERGEGAPLPVCDFSFDESGRLLALNERA